MIPKKETKVKIVWKCNQCGETNTLITDIRGDYWCDCEKSMITYINEVVSISPTNKLIEYARI